MIFFIFILLKKIAGKSDRRKRTTSAVANLDIARPEVAAQKVAPTLRRLHRPLNRVERWCVPRVFRVAPRSPVLRLTLRRGYRQVSIIAFEICMRTRMLCISYVYAYVNCSSGIIEILATFGSHDISIPRTSAAYDRIRYPRFRRRSVSPFIAEQDSGSMLCTWIFISSSLGLSSVELTGTDYFYFCDKNLWR